MTVEITIQPEATLDDIFRVAIKREAAAFHFYTEAASRVPTREARELLLKLAQDEAGHESALRQQWENLQAMRDVERAMACDV